MTTFRYAVKIVLSFLIRTYPVGAVCIWVAIVFATITWLGHIPVDDLAIDLQESEEVFDLKDWLEFIVPKIELGYGT